MRIVCLADTHGRHRELSVPTGDLLIHAGDLTSRGTLSQLADVYGWLVDLPHRHKVIVAGNHDFAFERESAAARELLPSSVTYLEGEGVKVEGLVVWGGPWVPLFASWAFELPPTQIQQRWAAIPDDVEILITHTPAAGTLDAVSAADNRQGCELLRRRVAKLSRLRLHVHGHIHESRCQAPIRLGNALAINAAQFRGSFADGLEPPIVVDLT